MTESKEPQERKSSPFFFPIIMACSLLIAVLLTPVIAQQIAYSINLGTERAKKDVAIETLKELPDVDIRIPWVVKRVAPSVVGIKTVMLVPHGRNIATVEGGGSGVIVDKAGYILTNYHVIQGTSELEVWLSDGRSTDRVERVGFDASMDLAVLKIDLGDLSAVDWGDSDGLEVGAQVLAIGSPYGFTQSVTAGIISAKDRHVSPDKPEGFLQTDAAVNPGSSGGPLVDMRGELVGINTMIFGESFRGISLSIPSNMTKKVYDNIRTTGGGGSMTHGWLGIGMNDVNDYYAQIMGLGATEGSVITYVMPDSPANKADIRIRDVIIEWDGKKVKDSKQLSEWIYAAKPGTEVEVLIARMNEKEKIKVKVTIGNRPDQLKKQP